VEAPARTEPRPGRSEKAGRFPKEVTTPRVIRWDPAWGPRSETAMRQRLLGAGYSVARYQYLPGTCFPAHSHEVCKRDAVLTGRLKISWSGGSIVLGPGDMIEIPPGAVHSAEVVGSETVLSLDATQSPEHKQGLRPEEAPR
jgi:quercetin dioxygenase-like cupin family protein